MTEEWEIKLQQEIDNWITPDGKEHHTSELKNIITDLIRSIISHHDQQLADEIEGMKKNIPEYTDDWDPTSWSEAGYEVDDGWNQALSAVLERLRK